MDKITLKPSDVMKLLVCGINERKPVFVGGPKGIGKSDLMAQAAHETKHKMMLTHSSVNDPTAFSGCPWPDLENGRVRMLPYGRLADALAITEPTVWLWEDFPHTPPAVQSSAMQLFLAREIEGHRIPDCVKIMAAGNLRKAGYGTHGVIEPMKGRVTLIEMVPNLDDFCNWCYANNQPPELPAFIRMSPDMLCPEATDPNWKSPGDFINDPNPRNWVEAFWWTQQGLPMHIEHAAVCGRVGPGPGSLCVGWLQTCRNTAGLLDYILLDPDKAEIPTKPDVRHAVACGLANKANEKNFPQIERYAQRLYSDGYGDISVFCLRDAVRRHPKIMTTAAWNKLASTPLGQLFTGGE